MSLFPVNKSTNQIATPFTQPIPPPHTITNKRELVSSYLKNPISMNNQITNNTGCIELDMVLARIFYHHGHFNLDHKISTHFNIYLGTLDGKTVCKIYEHLKENNMHPDLIKDCETHLRKNAIQNISDQCKEIIYLKRKHRDQENEIKNLKSVVIITETENQNLKKKKA